MKAKLPKAWRILHPNGTYYAGWTGIGPAFGATRENAQRLSSEQEALFASGHYGFVGCKLERPDGTFKDWP